MAEPKYYRAYISGPMKGVEHFNYPLFDKAQDDAIEQKSTFLGWANEFVKRKADKYTDVIFVNPAKNFNAETHHPREKYLAMALHQVQQCDAVILLPRWEFSEGARLEVQVALELNKDFYYAYEDNHIAFETVDAEEIEEILADTATCWGTGYYNPGKDAVEKGLNGVDGPEWEALDWDTDPNGTKSEASVAAMMEAAQEAATMGRIAKRLATPEAFLAQAGLAMAEGPALVGKWEDEATPKLDKTMSITTFESGATRDTQAGKLDFEGFLSPLVLVRYAEYMDEHRMQSNGQLRASDNWQKGFPRDSYMKSGFRHFMDVWALYRKHESQSGEDDIETAICATLFNLMGLLHEIQLGREAKW